MCFAMTIIMVVILPSRYYDAPLTPPTPDPMAIEIPQLPVAFMNEDHRHAAEQLEAMQFALEGYSADRLPLVTTSREFLQHNREHFGREELAMQASGFPPYAVHKGEHERVLAWLDQLVASIEAGVPESTLRQAILQDIPTWFHQHILTMDRATAAWLASH